MIKERLITILKISGIKNPELEEATGISRYTWQNVRNKADREIKEIEIEAIVTLFPQYAYWLTTGNIAPEIGQTSPAYDVADKKLQATSAG
ncbi:XRE family transcriptional regulator [Pseudomonas aeruginosa]|uniref:DNA-binding protein n=1 Tax=Pseudomonas aeruginosa TaxID=287 RepID=Q58CH6_PSEAI|nr:hypothetical protein [Pseudomonas aeruginosa]EAZ56798.1 hypothetical protein PACG_05553 [Pseudomonas aeruginosa C3719]RMK27606.1 hypothetical protein IPC1256_06895 [Pseudomonas aeruginosa]CAH61038.1 unnamed protein product [Pseudomonas aeruginosa]HBP0080345.1 XRE family transcriptional regulator [Pseudomonas aeruginosa]HBP0092036.1 XRE family transcriptional regulator [Pseudomonas aeruginosa]